jgi:SAM-dependent methyltransferase
VFTRSEHLYDAVYSFKDYTAEAARCHELIQAHAPGATTLLDVACGTGKHLEELARWYSVEGVDLDPEMVQLAQARLPGARLEIADMRSLDLARRFDAVTCLFSSIAYAGSVEGVEGTVAALARHLNPSGVLLLEPWVSPEAWETGRPRLLTVDEPDLKIARMNVGYLRDRLSILDFTYLVGTPDGVETFTEHHEAVLLTDEEYRGAFAAAGLTVELEAVGLSGRGLYIGTPAGLPA